MVIFSDNSLLKGKSSIEVIFENPTELCVSFLMKRFACLSERPSGTSFLHSLRHIGSPCSKRAKKVRGIDGGERENSFLESSLGSKLKKMDVLSLRCSN